MEKFIEYIGNLLKKDERLWSKDENPKLLKNELVSLITRDDEKLLELFISDKKAKERFFKKIGDSTIFLKERFLQFVTMDEFLPDSFTAFEIKVGLSSDGKLLGSQEAVSLVFPYKDCILEGGQETAEERRNEIFYNTILAPEEIDRLKEPKVLTNCIRYDGEGRHKTKEILEKDNLIIKGNNLLALYSLLPVYRGKIKLIYIDPPYNTGNDEFKYNDCFNHSTWLVFMKNRLEVAKELLSEEGSIFISIDNNEVSYLQILLDDIFGKQNKQNLITIKRSSVSGAKVINEGLVNVSEFLVVYSKNKSNWKTNKIYRKKDRDTRYSTYIKNIDEGFERWKFCTVLEAFADSLDVQRKELKQLLKDDYDQQLEQFYFDNAKRIIRFASLDDKSISDAIIKLKYKSKDDDSKVYHLQRDNKLDYYLYKGQAILFFESRLSEIDGEKVFGELLHDIWDDVLPNDLHNEGGISLKKGKKPEKLVQRILDISTNKNDLVLDFFAGSGTTGAVAHKMGRQYILVEQMDYIHDLPEQRLINVLKGDQTGISKAVNWKGGGSFVYTELLEWNKKYIDELEKASTKAEIKKIYNKIKQEAFYKYQIETKKMSEKDLFALSEKDQRQVIMDLLDMNHLYVNLESIGDATFGVSKEDKELNKKFYNQKQI